LNRKTLASAVAAGVLSAPVAIAVADEGNNTTEAAPAATAPEARVSEELRIRSQLRRDASRHEARRDARAARRARAKKRARAKSAAGGRSTASPALQAIAACESGGNPSAIGGGGAYRGKYQFDYGTWASVGGSGDPAAAPEAEQDKRAAILYSRAGSSPWPVCGR
jgi:hypothetical protein